MKKLLSFALLMLCCIGLAQAQVKKQKLRVLYVGGATDQYPDMYKNDEAAMQADVKARTAAFEALLSAYFTEVKVMDAADYVQDCSKGYDVTIMDGRPKQTLRPAVRDRVKQAYAPAAYFTEDFDLPVLAIGSASESIGRSVGLKNDWYCLCLDADAHHWDAHHPIFNGPFKTTITEVEKPTPADAFHYEYFTGPLPKTTKMWAVQTKGYMTHKGFAVGMVSRPWGYLDSPDTEVISSGVCAKTIDAVAIGRHGNFFHWGFAASPLYMTDEAKVVFANAVAYIAGFKGQTPIARKYQERMTTMEYLKELLYVCSEKGYLDRMKSDEEWNKEMLKEQAKAKAKQDKGETLTDAEKQYIAYEPQPQRTREEYYKRYMKKDYPQYGTDWQAYHKFLLDNKPYLYGGEGFYEYQVDEDAKSLGIGIHDLKLIDTAIELLESGQDIDKARRLLARYTLCDFATADRWRAWYKQYADKLFFTESGGWVWLVNSREPGVNDYAGWINRKALRSVTVGETSDENPVAIAADRQYTETGDQLLIIKFKLHPGYHIYEHVPEAGAFHTTEVEVSLPQGYTALGELQRPIGKNFENGIRIYEDEVVMTQRIAGSGKDPITVTVNYQCCDSQICFTPEEKQISVK